MTDDDTKKSDNFSEDSMDSAQVSPERERVCDKAQEYLDGWKRERAEFENYKKDETLRLQARDIFIKRMFLLKLLPILDSFDLALKNTPEDAKKSDWFLGYTFIQKQFEDFLKGEGIEIVETKEKEFNPTLHEAIEIEGEGERMTVQEELSRGYKIGEFVIRPARVKVQRTTNNQ